MRYRIEKALTVSKELACIISAVQGAECRFQRGHALRSPSQSANEQISIGAEIIAEDDLVGRVDGLIEIVTAEKEVERSIEIRRNPELLRERVDVGITDICSRRERCAGEIHILIGGQMSFAI